MALVESLMVSELTGRARDVAFLRADFAREKAAWHSDVQENGTFGDVMLVSGFTKNAKPVKNCR